MLSAKKDSGPLTSSIARPQMRRRGETVRATERMSAECLPVPLQYELAGDTSQPRTSALPLARNMSCTSRLALFTHAMRRARWSCVQFAPRARTPKLSAYDQRKLSDPMPCLLPSSGGVEWSREIKRGESALRRERTVVRDILIKKTSPTKKNPMEVW